MMKYKITYGALWMSDAEVDPSERESTTHNKAIKELADLLQSNIPFEGVYMCMVSSYDVDEYEFPEAYITRNPLQVIGFFRSRTDVNSICVWECKDFPDATSLADDWFGSSSLNGFNN